MQCRRRDPSRWPLRISASLIFVSSLLGAAETIAQRTAGTSLGTAPVEFFGCTALKGTAQQFSCMLVPDDQLTLWVRGRDCKDIQVSDSGQPLQAETKFIQGGCQLRLPRSSGLHQSTLTLTDRRTQQPLWSMPLDRSKPKLLEWKRKVWDRASVHPEDALPELQRMASTNLDSETLLDVTYALGQTYYRLGENSEALGAFLHAQYIAKKLDFRSIALNTGYDIVHIYRTEALHAEAQKSLADAASYVTAGDVFGINRLDAEAGLLAHDSEQLHVAQQHFERVYAAATRVRDRVAQLTMFSMLAQIYVRTDLLDEARQLLSETDAVLDGQTACRQSSLLANAADVGIQLLEDVTGGGLRASPSIGHRSLRAALHAALEFERQCPVGDANRASIYLDLLRLARMDGRYSEAQQWLGRAKASANPTAFQKIELLEEEGVLALAQGRNLDAHKLFLDMDATARKYPNSFPQTYLCRVSVGLAEARYALGQLDTATSTAVRQCLSRTNTGVSASLLRQLKARGQTLGVALP